MILGICEGLLAALLIISGIYDYNKGHKKLGIIYFVLAAIEASYSVWNIFIK